MTIQAILAGSGLHPATAAARHGGEVDLTGLGTPAAGPLLAQAQAAGQALAASLGQGGNAVVTARLEGAALAFGREVRALHIGGADLGPAARGRIVDAALDAGAQGAAALPDVGFDPADRLVAALEGAAQALSEGPSGPLYPFTGDRGV